MGGLIGYGAGGEEGAREGTGAGILEAAREKYGITEEDILEAAREKYGITEEDILEIIEAIPEGTAALLIIEHLWAKGLKQAIRDAGGVLVYAHT